MFGEACGLCGAERPGSRQGVLSRAPVAESRPKVRGERHDVGIAINRTKCPEWKTSNRSFALTIALCFQRHSRFVPDILVARKIGLFSLDSLPGVMETSTPGCVGFLALHPERAPPPARAEFVPVIGPSFGERLRAAGRCVCAIDLKFVGRVGGQFAAKWVLCLQAHGCCPPICLGHFFLSSLSLGVPGRVLIGEFRGSLAPELHHSVSGKRNGQ